MVNVPYFHVVFTVPAPIAAIALQNKAVVYDILFKAVGSAGGSRYSPRPAVLGQRFRSDCRQWVYRSSEERLVDLLTP
jgi:hypothetical protein